MVFAVVLLVVEIVEARAPGRGMYLVAVLAGTTNVDAITLSMADYARRGSAEVAVDAITLGALSNTVVKAGIVLVLGDRALRSPTLIATAAVLAVGLATILLT
jgi:uncharacterized membrane protein (DUF4010 family)